MPAAAPALSDFDISDDAHLMIQDALRASASILVSGATGSGMEELAEAVIGKDGTCGEIRTKDDAQQFLDDIKKQEGRIAVIHAIGGLSLLRLLVIANVTRVPTELPELVHSFQNELRDRERKLLGLHVARQSNGRFRVTAQDLVRGVVS